MSLVLAPYEECDGFINITDEYTNNLLRLSGVSDINLSCYAVLCIRGDFVEYLLDYATKSAYHAYYYAKQALKSRFELGEILIAADPEYSYLYARYVLKGRFELGEILIAANPEYSYLYARDILKGRFELGEQAIAGDSDFKKEYFELTGIEL